MVASMVLAAVLSSSGDAGYESGKALFAEGGCVKCHGPDAQKPVDTGMVLTRRLQGVPRPKAVERIKTRKPDWTDAQAEAVATFLRPCSKDCEDSATVRPQPPRQPPPTEPMTTSRRD